MEKNLVCLAIESSCDETSAAVVVDGRKVLSNIISTQIDIHKAYGGVVPEIASRHHLNNINPVIDEALQTAGISFKDLDFICVTNRPGLIGALLIGTASAKALAYALNIPLIGVHHIRGHICANYIAHPELEPPFAALVVSGGHSTLADVKGYTDYEIVGRTRDDAAGEAFDKVARVLGLGYPGGPLLDRLAKEGNPEAIPFKRVYLEKDSFDFSFSGTKTGVLNYLNSKKQKKEEVVPADVAASFQEAVVEVLVAKSVRLAKERGREKLVLAGGVAANSHLRAKLAEACDREGIKLFAPPPVLCTDNAAMIGCAGYYEYVAGAKDEKMNLDAFATAPLDISLNQPNSETLAALMEAKRIARDPNVKGYSDLDELFRDLLDK